MQNPTNPPGPSVPIYLWRIWAKWSKTGENAPKEGETYHPLICHMLDVTTVARHLWGTALPAPTRERLTRHLGLGDEGESATWIAFFTGLHDIGKASPGFQDQLSETSAGTTIRGWMQEASLDFSSSEWVAHGAVSARVLGYTLEDLGVGERLAEQIALLVGGHHGLFPRQFELNNLKERHQVGSGAWDTIRADLTAALRDVLQVPHHAPTGVLTPADAMVFAGFVTVADWIGSNEAYFQHAGRFTSAPNPLPLTSYRELAEQRAMEALRTVRLDAYTADREGCSRQRTFAELFPEIKKPYDAQVATIELAEHLNGPALVILEAPMGEGKTEAALYLADSWAVTQSRQGMYLALPTQATSNQMYMRVRKYLDLRFASADYVAAHLVYGQAALNAAYQERLEQGRRRLEPTQAGLTGQTVAAQGEEDAESGAAVSAQEWLELESEGPVYDGRGEVAGEDGAVIAAEWFAAPKRALLAPFGVGTLDQALLGVLQTKHFFVRLFGLAGKTVIVDEVHAYDTYMSALLDRLLEWLGAFGTPVVLLSATLPKVKRTQLQVAYARGAEWLTLLPADANTAAYPRLTWVSEGDSGAREVVASAEMTRVISVEWLDRAAPDAEEGIAALGERLCQALSSGGCAAIICNTVARAQTVYRGLQQYFPGVADDNFPELDLFHARFPRGERIKREERALRRFGRGTNVRRPRRAVLVATQVIEQSLDLDFDLMVSDLAPVDLLLQRAGRLHRHRENDPERPAAVAEPRLLIPRPVERDGCPQFPQPDEFVYDAHILLRTWLALDPTTREYIHLPGEIEELIEQVYSSTAVCPTDALLAVRSYWEQSRVKYERGTDDDLNKARLRRVAAPGDDAIYTGRNLQLKEVDEAPQSEAVALALTRLGPPSVSVVLLPTAEAQRQWNATGRPPGRAATLGLLNRAVSIAHGVVAPVLIEQEPPVTWKQSPWLRHARLVALDASGQAGIPVRTREGGAPYLYTLKLDPDIGVVIQRAPRGQSRA